MHPKGPWKVEDDILFDCRVVGPKDIGGARPIMYQGDQANAHLIAAAPDLLEACKAVLGKCNDSALITMLEAAIAKAEGRQ